MTTSCSWALWRKFWPQSQKMYIEIFATKMPFSGFGKQKCRDSEFLGWFHTHSANLTHSEVAQTLWPLWPCKFGWASWCGYWITAICDTLPILVLELPCPFVGSSVRNCARVLGWMKSRDRSSIKDSTIQIIFKYFVQEEPEDTGTPMATYRLIQYLIIKKIWKQCSKKVHLIVSF